MPAFFSMLASSSLTCGMQPIGIAAGSQGWQKARRLGGHLLDLGLRAGLDLLCQINLLLQLLHKRQDLPVGSLKLPFCLALRRIRGDDRSMQEERAGAVVGGQGEWGEGRNGTGKELRSRMAGRGGD